MTISLTEALQQVQLEAGRVYHCQVGELRVEVRVEDAASMSPPTPMQDSDVMLDPWSDLPAPEVVAILQASAGSPVLPDPPQIPPSEAHG